MHRLCLLVLPHVLLGSLAQLLSADPADRVSAGHEVMSIVDEVFQEFFSETNSDRALLEAIDISPEEEVRIGKRDLQLFLDTLRSRELRIVQSGTNASYLKSLVAEIHPLMRNAKRYRSISVYVVETTTTDARAFPGGSRPVSACPIRTGSVSRMSSA